MIRDGLAPGAAYAAVLVNAAGDGFAQMRAVANGQSSFAGAIRSRRSGTYI